MSASDNSSVKKKFNWLGASAWGAGSAIFGWLLAGLIYQRDYRHLTWDTLGWADWVMTFVFGGLSALLAFGIFLKRNKTSADSETESGVDFSDTFSRVLSALLPALYLVLALATLVLTLATYNGDWTEARQGLATGFAALLAAVGAIISVYVTYKIGEENRKAQQENLNLQLTQQTDNLEKQLKHQVESLEKQLEQQRLIEDSKDKREQDKQDAETIKSLNDRLHDIIPRRNSDKEKEEEREKERISSYFQLAALYKDWDLLAENSEKIEKQRANQQKYILKLLFGTAKRDGDGNFIKVRTSDEDIALNSIISDIFPVSDGYVGSKENSISDSENIEFSGYDLEYADLSHLDFSGQYFYKCNFNSASFLGANLYNVKFSECRVRKVDLSYAKMWKVKFSDKHDFAYADMRFCEMGIYSYLKFRDYKDYDIELDDDGADFWIEEASNLSRCILEHVKFDGSDMSGVDLSQAYLFGSSFKDSDIRHVDFYDSTFYADTAHTELPEGYLELGELADQISQAREIPSDEILEGIDLPFDSSDFLAEIKRRHTKLKRK